HLNASGADVLKAVILGYEVFSRLGRTVNPSHYRTWHTTGTCGTIAAAAAAASLLKLSAEETNNAIGIAATMAGGLVESFGSHAKAINIAEACQNGIDAASLAKLGLTGSHSALLGKKGFVAATCTEPHTENLTHLSEDALVSDSAFYKVYSSCGHTNSPLDVLFKLMAKYTINPKEIERIDVATYKVAFDLTSQLKTATEDEAKFSLPFCFAISLLKGSVSLANFSQAVRTDPEVLDLARRVHVIESPEATSRFPHRQAEVSIVMKDGTVYADKTLDAHDSTTPEQIVAKFEAAVNEMDASKRQRIIQFVIDLGKQKSIAPLMDLLA
ncbi:MAG: MmgE/PrpD family protein, partial [Sutterella sp.]|nr:MmgE/PrpD family protein [Sutterella sp.]